MFLKYFYDPALAHASYLVGFQRTGEAIVIDPGRDIAEYLKVAAREGLRVTATAETHIHADYVSGARELAARCGAKLLLSDTGPAAWKYAYAREYPATLLQDGDAFQVGNIGFSVMHTPGHTPESISFVLTDRGGGADKPMGVFTGDFVFVGAVGRPDLLESAAGIVGSADAGARDLFRSVQRFKQLPDYLQVWPAHGAGSACGKGLGAVPSSTVGYEKLCNPALQIDDEQAFVAYILAEQPEVPRYFAVMKRVNRSGPLVLGEQELPVKLDVATLPALARSHTVIDIAPTKVFAQAHVAGVLNIPIGILAPWAGHLIDVEQPVYLVAEGGQVAEATRVLRKIGVDQLAGYFDRQEILGAALPAQACPTLSPAALQEAVVRGERVLLDVRARSEWNAERIPGAQHLFLGEMPRRAREFAARKVAVHCLAEGRSAIAASVLQAAGVDVVRMAGGITAWKEAGLRVERGG